MQKRKLFTVIMTIIVISLATVVTVSLLQEDTIFAQNPQSSDPHLTDADIKQILDGTEEAANQQDSLLRVNLQGEKQKTRMHIVVVDRSGKIVGQRTMTDAWLGSINIAKAKAFTAVSSPTTKRLMGI